MRLTSGKWKEAGCSKGVEYGKEEECGKKKNAIKKKNVVNKINVISINGSSVGLQGCFSSTDLSSGEATMVGPL